MNVSPPLKAFVDKVLSHTLFALSPNDFKNTRVLKQMQRKNTKADEANLPSKVEGIPETTHGRGRIKKSPALIRMVRDVPVASKFMARLATDRLKVRTGFWYQASYSSVSD
jgi:hypothetical protein